MVSTLKRNKNALSLLPLALLVLMLAAALPSRVLAQWGKVSVYGRVVDPEGRPIGGVEVSIYSAGAAGGIGAFVLRTVTSSTGGFTAMLDPGVYTAVFDKVGYERREFTFAVPSEASYQQLGDITLGYSLALMPQVESVETKCLSVVTVSVTLQERGSREERVSLEVKAPEGWKATLLLDDVAVRVLTLSPGQSQALQLRIEIPFNASGTYNVTLTAAGYTVQRRVITFHVEHADPQLLSTTSRFIRVVPGSTASFEVTLSNTLGREVTALLSVSAPSGWAVSLVDAASGSPLTGVSLKPGEALRLRVVVSPPSSTPTGNYTVAVLLTGVQPYFVSQLQTTLIVARGQPLIRLQTDTPHLDAYAGQSASFPVTAKNLGDGDSEVDLKVAGLPTGFTWQIRDTAGNVVSRIYLRAGEEKQVRVVVSVPPLAEPTAVSFTLEANASGSTSSLQLGLGVLGSYSLGYETQNFYVENTAGQESTFQVVVKNTGYSSLTNLKLEALGAPKGFRVAVSPDVVLVLKPQETASFTVTITTQSDVSAGDYYILLRPSADQLTPDQVTALTRPLHVYVKPSGTAVYIGVAALLVLVALTFIVYRRYGRR